LLAGDPPVVRLGAENGALRGSRGRTSTGAVRRRRPRRPGGLAAAGARRYRHLAHRSPSGVHLRRSRGAARPRRLTRKVVAWSRTRRVVDIGRWVFRRRLAADVTYTAISTRRTS